MKKILSFISAMAFGLVLTSCAEKEKVDPADASEEIVNAIDKSVELSKELTTIQVEAAKDNELDADEIDMIVEKFKELAIVNNNNLKNYGTDVYFIALRLERRPILDSLGKEVVHLKDCKGWEELGEAINKASLEVKDVTELPEATTPEDESISITPDDTLGIEVTETPDDIQ